MLLSNPFRTYSFKKHCPVTSFLSLNNTLLSENAIFSYMRLASRNERTKFMILKILLTHFYDLFLLRQFFVLAFFKTRSRVMSE